MTDEEKAKAYPNDFYWQYERNEKAVNQEKEANKVAQSKFENAPQGSDEYKPIGIVKEGEMGLILTYTSRFDNSPNLKIYYLMLNDHNLFFSEKEEHGYRGILGAIKITNLYDKKIDDVRFG